MKRSRGRQLMALDAGRLIGQLWDDCQHLNKLIKASRFNLSCKSESDFETRLSGLLDAHRQKFKGQLITQVDKEASVQSVYCFGKSISSKWPSTKTASPLS